MSEYFPVKRKGLRAGLCLLSVPPDSSDTSGIRHRRPRAGERTRGGADALQTKIAVAVQNLEPARFKEQLQDIVGEIPDAAGCDSAFVVLISEDGRRLLFGCCLRLRGHERRGRAESLIPCPAILAQRRRAAQYIRDQKRDLLLVPCLRTGGRQTNT